MPKIKIGLLLWLMSTMLAPVLMAQDDGDNDADSQNESASSQLAESNNQNTDYVAAVQDTATAANAQSSLENIDQSDAQTGVNDTGVNDDAVAGESTNLSALTLVAQPIYPRYLAASVYMPLADYLAEGLAREIELITPKNFQAHWSAIKSGVQHDLAIEEAPLTDYRIRYRQYQPLVQSASEQSYSLAVLNSSYDDRFELIGRPVASLAAPSSAYLFLTRWYDNPLSQPLIISTATSYADAVQQLWGGEVEGVVLPSELATDYPQFSFIATSESMPGLAITASPELDQHTVNSIIELFMTLNDEQYIAILDELNVSKLELADAQRVNGYAEWIRNVSYTGFK